VMILVDTNVLLRLGDPVSSDCRPARAATAALRQRGERLVIAAQSLYEFWSVATRPPGKPPQGVNGLGMSVSRADQWLGYVLRTFELLPDHPELTARWRDLVRTHNVVGAKSHDARLAAAMQVHQIGELLTFNGADFNRYAFVRVIDPHKV
jgi:predicted nucleic acid-binding protein